MSDKSIIIVGSGPGIGVTSASHFASQGFTVALLSRNKQRLQEDASKVKAASDSSSSSAKVHTYAVDVGDHNALKQTLDQVKEDLGNPEVVLFNAAKVAQSTIGKESPEALIDNFKVIKKKNKMLH
jgi:NAD(P)-dependent dehydrogenase (short-subunit alcohol dehydrogenase family)